MCAYVILFVEKHLCVPQQKTQSTMNSLCCVLNLPYNVSTASTMVLCACVLTMLAVVLYAVCLMYCAWRGVFVYQFTQSNALCVCAVCVVSVLATFHLISIVLFLMVFIYCHGDLHLIGECCVYCS